MRTLEKTVRKILPRLNLKKVKVIFDTTEDLTWSKPSHKTRASVYQHNLQCWNFPNLSIVEPYFIPLMSIPYTMLDNLDNLVINLVGYLESLSLSVSLILFDRGFYHTHLIDFLNSRNLPYLMLVRKTPSVKKYIERTKIFGYYNHKMIYQKDMSTWETHATIIIKKVKENDYFCYATNCKPSIWSTLEYKKMEY